MCVRFGFNGKRESQHKSRKVSYPVVVSSRTEASCRLVAFTLFGVVRSFGVGVVGRLDVQVEMRLRLAVALAVGFIETSRTVQVQGCTFEHGSSTVVSFKTTR